MARLRPVSPPATASRACPRGAFIEYRAVVATAGVAHTLPRRSLSRMRCSVCPLACRPCSAYFLHQASGGMPSVKIEFCPRCGTKRPDELQWCRKCGLDFHKAERGELPAGVSAPPRTPPGGWAVDKFDPPQPGQPQWQQPYVPVVEVRPGGDRQSMARWTSNALDVRCGGTVGGCLGMVLGFVLFGYLGAVIGGVAPLLLIPLGVMVGLFAGMRLALSLMSR